MFLKVNFLGQKCFPKDLDKFCLTAFLKGGNDLHPILAGCACISVSLEPRSSAIFNHLSHLVAKYKGST